jgi:hypothetical protein
MGRCAQSRRRRAPGAERVRRRARLHISIPLVILSFPITFALVNAGVAACNDVVRGTAT